MGLKWNIAEFSEKTDLPHHPNYSIVAILIMTCDLEKNNSDCHYCLRVAILLFKKSVVLDK